MLTRIWISLVAVALGAALAGIYVVADSLDAEASARSRALLARDVQGVAEALALEARLHVDETAPLAVHPEVRGALAAASSGEPFDAAALASALRSLDRELPGGEADRLLVVRADGRIVVDLGGDDERPEGAGLGAFPVVRDALRGYLGDDVLVYDRQVLRVAARPVVEEGRYVGAIVHGRALDAGHAADLQAKIPGAAVAFFRGTKLLASAADEDEVLSSGALEGALEQTGGDPEARDLELERGGFAAVAPVTGSAAHVGVGLLIARPAPPATDPRALLSSATRDDLRVVPWPIAGGAALLVALIGWALVSVDLRRVRRREREAPAASPQPAGDSQKTEAPSPAAPSPEPLPAPPPAETFPEPAPPVAPVGAAPATDRDEEAARPEAAAPEEEEAEEAPAPAAKPEPEAPPLPEPPPAEAPGILTPPAPKPTGGDSLPEVPPAPRAPAAPAPPPFDPDGFDDDGATTVAEIPRELIQAVQDREAPPVDPETAHFQEVFEQFVDLKKQLGEPTAGLSFERFEQTLKKNRDAIVAKHGVSTVRFTVYDKGGKAALRATPVK